MNRRKIMTISDLRKTDNFFLLAGPCVIEGEEMALRIADRIVKMQINWVFPMCLKDLIVRLTVPVWIRLQE